MARQGLTASCSFKTFSDGQAKLARFVCLSALLLPLFQSSSHAESKKKEGVVSKNASENTSSLEKLEHALSKAHTASEARALLAQANAVRLTKLTPAVFILVQQGRDLQKQNKLNEAEHILGSALTLQPDQAILWRFRALIRMQGRDEAGAIADLGVALQLDPLDADSWRLLSQVERQCGNAIAALKAKRKAETLDPASKSDATAFGSTSTPSPQPEL